MAVCVHRIKLLYWFSSCNKWYKIWADINRSLFEVSFIDAWKCGMLLSELFLTWTNLPLFTLRILSLQHWAAPPFWFCALYGTKSNTVRFLFHPAHRTFCGDVFTHAELIIQVIVNALVILNLSSVVLWVFSFCFIAMSSSRFHCYNC